MKEFIKNSILLITSIFITILITEFFIRLLLPQQLILLRPDIWQSDDFLGWKHKPSLKTTVNTGEKMVNILTDENGYRVGVKKIISPKYTILALGDSFIAAFQVEYEESVAGQLESVLFENLGQSVEVVNTAVDEWDPNQYLMQARYELSKRKYDLVLVFLYMGNDIVSERYYKRQPREKSLKHEFRLPKKIEKTELINAVLYPINDYLEVRSHLFILFKKRLQPLLMKLGLTALYFPYKYYRSAEQSPMWRLTASICRDINDLAITHGSKTIFILIPTPYEVDANTFKEYSSTFNIDPFSVDLDQPNRLLKSGLASYDLTTIDLLQVMRIENAKGKDLYGRVDTHLNVAGNKLVAETLAPMIEEILR